MPKKGIIRSLTNVFNYFGCTRGTAVKTSTIHPQDDYHRESPSDSSSRDSSGSDLRVALDVNSPSVSNISLPHLTISPRSAFSKYHKKTSSDSDASHTEKRDSLTSTAASSESDYTEPVPKAVAETNSLSDKKYAMLKLKLFNAAFSLNSQEMSVLSKTIIKSNIDIDVVFKAETGYNLLHYAIKGFTEKYNTEGENSDYKEFYTQGVMDNLLCTIEWILHIPTGSKLIDKPNHKGETFRELFCKLDQQHSFHHNQQYREMVEQYNLEHVFPPEYHEPHYRFEEESCMTTSGMITYKSSEWF
jgi:hypothetical protein